MKKAGDLLPDFLGKMGITDSNNYAGLFSAWSKIAGPEFEVHSKLSDIRKGILFVDVDHPGWMQKIMFSQKKILQAVRKSFPQLGVQEIAFRLVDKLENRQIKTIEDNLLYEIDTMENEDKKIHSSFDDIEKKIKDDVFIESMKSLKKSMDNNPKLRKSRKPE